MEIAALEMLIRNGESYTLEFKIAPPRLAELAERLCGFANSKLGGSLIIGVADVSWDIVGVKSVGDAVDALVQAARKCKPPVPFASSQPQVIDIKGKKLVLAQVPPNDGILYQAWGIYWLRRGTQTTAMDTEELMSFLYRQGTLHWELQSVSNAVLSDLNLEKVRDYMTRLTTTSGRPLRVTDPIELLLKLSCATKSSQDTEIHPTNAGMLLFGYNSNLFLTQAQVVATFYQDANGVRGFTDRKFISGTIPEMIDEAASLLTRWTPIGGHIDGFRRIDEAELPLEALREAVVNAVVHRDYSIEGTAVRIFYYSDRVEIHNPGILPGGVTLEALRNGRAPSKPRNPVIASILKDLPGGYMERVGSGISFMIYQMREAGLPDPEFKEQDEFVVTFLRGHGEAKSTSTQLTNEVPTAVVSQSGLTPLERRELALKFVRENGSITYKQYRALTGASETTAIRDLDALVESGAIQKVGKGPATRYRL